jgi:hypothetical protein
MIAVYTTNIVCNLSRQSFRELARSFLFLDCVNPPQPAAFSYRDVRLQSRSLRHSPRPTGLREVVSDDFPVLHATGMSDRFRVLATQLNPNQSSSLGRSIAQARAPALPVRPRESQPARAPVAE